MNAPDRSATVRAFYAAHPEHFTADRHDENRRRSLPALIAHLEATHPSDRGKWGVLVKTDRNNKVPCDVIVWKDTDQSIDIMDSQGGLWAPHDGTIQLPAAMPGSGRRHRWSIRPARNARCKGRRSNRRRDRT